MRRLLLILAFALTGIAAGAQPAERITYSLCFKWGAVQTEVGRATFVTRSVDYKGQEAIHSTIEGKTAPFFDAFYKIREKFESWMLMDGILPMEYRRDTYENGYLADNHYVYDWPWKVIHANVKFGDKPRKELDIPLEKGVYDLPAMLPYLRSIDYASQAKGGTQVVKVAIDDEVFSIRIRFLGPEVVKVRKKGGMDSYKIAISLVAGAIFDEGKELSVWMSADEKKVPLALMVPLKVGTVRAWFQDYSYE